VRSSVEEKRRIIFEKYICVRLDDRLDATTINDVSIDTNN